MDWFSDKIYGPSQSLVTYLSNHYNIGKGILYSAIKNKKILIDNKKINSSYRLKNGDHLTIKIPLGPISIPHNEYFIKPIDHRYRNYEQLLKDIIIYENDDFFIINKPMNWASQGGSNNPLNLDDLFNYYDKSHYIVHRLDQETSGLMMMASNRNTAKILGNMFKNNSIEKDYWAITPYLRDNSWSYQCYIGDKGYDLSIKDFNSHTIFTKIKDVNEYSWWHVQLMTGKKHQIRIHCHLKGIPIIADYKYQGPSAPRMYLHSYRLKFFYNKPHEFIHHNKDFNEFLS